MLDDTKTIITKVNAAINQPWGVPMAVTAFDDILYAEYFINTKRTVLDNINNQIVSLDDRILNTVIRPIVLVDCNLVGGIDMSIDLFLVDVARQPDYGYIITIDKKHTGGRSILAAYDIICNVVSTALLF